MRRLMKNWLNDDLWAIGVLEPFLLLLFIAVIGALLRTPLANKPILGSEPRWTSGRTHREPRSSNVRSGSEADVGPTVANKQLP